VASDNTSLLPSVSSVTTGSYRLKSVRAADDVSDAEALQTNDYKWFSNLYKFRDGIQFSQIVRYCSECQG